MVTVTWIELVYIFAFQARLVVFYSCYHFIQHYMNDLPDVIHWSRALLFADDIKCFKHIKSHDEEQYLQTDLHNLASWSVHLIYLSILLRVSMYHVIKQFPHHKTSEVMTKAGGSGRAARAMALPHFGLSHHVTLNE